MSCSTSHHRKHLHSSTWNLSPSKLFCTRYRKQIGMEGEMGECLCVCVCVSDQSHWFQVDITGVVDTNTFLCFLMWFSHCWIELYGAVLPDSANTWTQVQHLQLGLTCGYSLWPGCLITTPCTVTLLPPSRVWNFLSKHCGRAQALSLPNTPFPVALRHPGYFPRAFYVLCL